MLDPIVATYWTELVRIFGPWAMLPITLLGGMIYGAITLVRTQRATIKTLEAEKARQASEIRTLHEARLSDAATMLREMWRVTRETEQARAERRELDQRFLPVQEGLLEFLAAQQSEKASR